MADRFFSRVEQFLENQRAISSLSIIMFLISVILVAGTVFLIELDPVLARFMG